MTNSDLGDAGGSEPDDLESDLSEDDESKLRELLKGALAKPQEDDPELDVLGDVQKALRERSGGKFYSDGWSTDRHPPVTTYLVTSVIMLAIVGVTYALLGPLSGKPQGTSMEPLPVQVLPPPKNIIPWGKTRPKPPAPAPSTPANSPGH